MIFKKWNNLHNKLKDLSFSSCYLHAYKKPIIEHSILFHFDESKEGLQQAMCFLNALSKEDWQTQNYSFFLACSKIIKSELESFLAGQTNLSIHLVPYHTKLYYNYLATVKYIYYDIPLPQIFSKRDNQILIYNTHLTANQELFQTNQSKNQLAYIQQMLLNADYILNVSESKITDLLFKYQLNGIIKGSFLFPDLLEEKKTTSFSFEETADMLTCVLRRILLGQHTCREIQPAQTNKKKVLIFCSDLRKNGITTSLHNLIELANRRQTLYFFTYKEEVFSNCVERFEQLPRDTFLFPIRGGFHCGSFFDQLCHTLYFRFNFDTAPLRKRIHQIYAREYKRLFGQVSFQTVIHFTGYAPDFMLLFQEAPAPAKRIVFAHNDMYAEYQEKHNFHFPTLVHAYQQYDHVIAVSEAVKKSIAKIDKNLTNITVLENAHDYQTILKKAELPFVLDAESSISCPIEKLKDMLLCDKTKFITIGRFSEEKGHQKLLSAFELIHQAHSNTILIIIGGYGTFYEETLLFAKSLSCVDSVVLLRSIPNPFPILKQCNLFLLPSDREPLGLVLLEADTLNIPIAATNVPGSGDFLKRFGGYVTENSINGLVTAMEDYFLGKIQPLHIDFETYNQKIIEQFEDFIH